MRLGVLRKPTNATHRALRKMENANDFGVVSDAY